MSVQLRERHWRIFSLSGTLETVRGRGVVGQEPVLSKILPAFQYSSHVSLQAASGHMWYVFIIILCLIYFSKNYFVYNNLIIKEIIIFFYSLIKL